MRIRCRYKEGETIKKYNTFFFTTQIKAVLVVCAEISGLPETAMAYEQLNVSVTPKNMTDETVEWKLSYISEEDAASSIEEYGLKYLWITCKGWQDISRSEVTQGTLTELGGQTSFITPGIYCLRTSVTDQYGETEERYSVIRITQGS